VAEEDCCFFNVYLPNYTADGLRRITFFKECPVSNQSNDEHFAYSDFGYSTETMLQYNTTPPVMPSGHEVTEVDYRGEMLYDQKVM